MEPDTSTRGRVLVVEEHELLASGMQLALSERRWQTETSGGPTQRDVMDAASAHRPDVVLVDADRPYGSRLGHCVDLIPSLRSMGAQVLVLTSERRRTALAEYVEAGAAGWIRSTAPIDELDAALARVTRGQEIIGRTERVALLDHLRRERVQARHSCAVFEQLTDREALVLAALIDGLNAEEIAQEHVVALTTVRSQIRAILNKLGVRSQLAAVAAASAHRDLLPRRNRPGRERRRAQTPERTADLAEHIA